MGQGRGVTAMVLCRATRPTLPLPRLHATFLRSLNQHTAVEGVAAKVCPWRLLGFKCGLEWYKAGEIKVLSLRKIESSVVAFRSVRPAGRSGWLWRQVLHIHSFPLQYCFHRVRARGFFMS